MKSPSSFALRLPAFVGLLLFLANGAFASTGVKFDGTNDFVTFGSASSLGLQRFTLEVWFVRQGAGVGVSTGTGGLTSAIPILTKGRGEADGSTLDMNYFLGIDASSGVLVADFEEMTPGPNPGLNHPVSGLTPIALNVWYHAAVTYDGSNWRLYLNGSLERDLAVGRTPQSGSVQHAALASALNSSGTASGYFNGILDEARIWNRARSQADIADSLDIDLTTAPGMVGRWGLDEGTGTLAANSVAGGANGTLTNGPLWMTGSPFTIAPRSLQFGGTNAYVSFGNAPALNLSEFTLETWFRRDGPGISTSTGAGGIDAIPLVTRGRAESDGSTVDMNYFLGIRASDGVLVADFEEAAGQPVPGLNHPVAGVTPIVSGNWYHAAATYDGTNWRLYLNGALEADLVVGRAPQSASIQHAALASALTSTGAAAGFFNGVLDEVRVWNRARTLGEIQLTINTELTTGDPDLVARWALDEASGATIQGSAGTAVNGTVTGALWSRWAPAPFNISLVPEPPDAPSNLAAAAQTHALVRITWTNNADNASAIQIERSVTGVAGTYVPLDTIPPSSTWYDDAGLSAEAEYCYRIRAANLVGPSAWTEPACATTPSESNSGLFFGGTSGYVSFGVAPELASPVFTIETWFRRDGAGASTTTGTGGIADAIPLVTKGRGEAESGTVDMNYFLGIRASDGVLVADFEETTPGPNPGLNHPIAGVTPIVPGTWNHAAAVYDGTAWSLYLNGILEGTLVVGRTPQGASIQHAALATGLTSTGTPEGFFHGVLDEVRIWHVARTQSEIRSAINSQLPGPEAGLEARWSLNEGSGSTVSPSTGTTVGSLMGANWSWTGGAPFNLVFNDPPAAPVLMAPADSAVEVALSPYLAVEVSDPEGATLTVTYHGRMVDTAEAASDFTLIGLPDTQYYTSALNGGTPAMFEAQTNWIVANRVSRNIQGVVQLGDCTEHGDNGGDPIEWQRADVAMSFLENPVTTGLAHGIPYGICVGNHDQSPSGNADGTTMFFNQYFGAARFSGRGYYGGHYGSNNDNHFQLYSAGNLDFIQICFEYDTSPDGAVLNWADSLLAVYPQRRGIVATHNLIGTGNPGAFSTQGQAIYNALKDRPNLFLMLGGHVPGEGRRQDTFEGRTVTSLLSDFQSRTIGGNGWLRILEFSPAAGTVHVRTYSPVLDQFEIDADSDFTFNYAMQALEPFQVIGTASGVPSGSMVEISWPDLLPERTWEWYVTVSDGMKTVTGPIWRFTTQGATSDASGPDPARISLGPAFPNPAASDRVVIPFSTPVTGAVRLQVFDVSGRLVTTLENRVLESGRHEAVWNRHDARGRPVSSGFYVVRLVAGKDVRTAALRVVK